jgi:hypothetical protein
MYYLRTRRLGYLVPGYFSTSRHDGSVQQYT